LPHHNPLNQLIPRSDRNGTRQSITSRPSEKDILIEKKNEGIGLKNKPHIAVVDDDESVREALENLISSVGFEVRLFASAEAFLDSDAPLKTDCAVLDLGLPGISGFELQRKLAADGLRIPVIIITALGDDKSRTEADTAGAIAFLKKPFKEEELLAAIDSALKRNLR
jgi:FixJ family two-component response regulator